MTSSEAQTSDPVVGVPIVRTARWVALAMLLIAVAASAALWLSWRDFKYAQDTRNALTGSIQTIRDGYDAALLSLRQQIKETDDKNRDLQGELRVMTTRLQLTQDDIELARRQARLLNHNQAEQGVQLPARAQVVVKSNGEDVKAADGELARPTKEGQEHPND